MNFQFFSRNCVGMWLLLLIYSGTILFVNIQDGGIYSAQEGRAAIIARNMLRSGDFSRIVIKGEPEHEKPIFCYWLYALSGKILGVNEFSVRLPSVLAALVTILAAAYLGMRIYGQPTGYVAGYVLATMHGFVNLGRLARIDIVMCAFYTLAMVLLYEGYFRNRKGNAWLYLFYIVMALSVAVKGPVSVFLIGLTVLILILMEGITEKGGAIFRERRWIAGAYDFRKALKMLWELKPLSGLMICLVICVPWMMMEVARTQENFAWEFFWTQNIDRFLGIQTAFSEGKRKTFFFYFPKLFALALPWALFVPFLLWQYRKAWFGLRKQSWFLVIWVLAVFAFFSLSFIKRGDYILPLFPALAILLGRYVVLEMEKEHKLTRHWIKVWIALAAVVLIAWIGIIRGYFARLADAAIAGDIPHITARDGMVFRDYLEIGSANPWITLLLAGVALGVLYLLGSQLRNGRTNRAFFSVMAVLMMAFLFYYLCLDPVSNRKRTTKEFCLRIQPHLPADAVVGYQGSWIDEAVFFVDRDYERCYDLSHAYDRKRNRFKFRYLVVDSDYYDEVLKKGKGAN